MTTSRSQTKIITGLFAILALFQLIAATPDASDDRYVPMADGTTWTMNLQMTAPDGNVLKGTARRVISKPIERDGKLYMHSTTSIHPDGFPSQSFTKLARKDAAGFHSICIFMPEAKEELEMPLPLKVGMTWQTQFPTPTKHTVVAKETVTLEGKTYKDCFKVHMEAKDGSSTEDYWEAPDIGTIKSEFTQNGIKFKLTLQEYTPGKPSQK